MARRYATVEDIVCDGGYAPEYAEVKDRIPIWLNLAQKMIGLQRYDDCACDAHALLTAHFLEAYVGIDGEGGSETGALASEAHGPANRGFATKEPTDAELSTTSYGRAFLLYRRRVRGRGAAVVMNSCARQLE
jgi:hypothetical protein